MKRHLLVPFLAVALTFAVTTPARAMAGISTSNLVLYVDATDPDSFAGSGSSLWNDLSPVGTNDLALSPSQTFNSSLGGYLTFNGTSDSATITSPTSLPATSMSVFAWIKVPATISALQEIFDFNRHLGAIDHEGLFQVTSSNQLNFWDYNGSNYGFNGPASTCTLTPSAWAYVGFIRSGNTGTYWLNGSACNSITAAVSTVNYSSASVKKNYAIGADVRNVGNFFSGSIANVAVYSTAIDTPTVRANMVNTMVRSVSLTVTSPNKKTATSSITAAGYTGVPFLATFYYNTRRITPCRYLSGSSPIACSWKPIIQGQQSLSASLSVPGTTAESNRTPSINVTVTKRTVARS